MLRVVIDSPETSQEASLNNQEIFDKLLADNKLQEACDFLFQPNRESFARTLMVTNAFINCFEKGKVFNDDESFLKFMAKFTPRARGFICDASEYFHPQFAKKNPNFKVTNIRERLEFMYNYLTHVKSDVDAAYKAMLKIEELAADPERDPMLALLSRCLRAGNYKGMIEKLETLSINDWKSAMRKMATLLPMLEEANRQLGTGIWAQQNQPNQSAANNEKKTGSSIVHIITHK
jgi:hypothetical protein